MIDIDRMTAYADESEQIDAAGAPYLIAAYILPASKWLSFADDWYNCCVNREPRIGYFHAIEAESLTGEFLDMKPEFRNAKLRDLAAIIQKWEPVNIQCWVSRDNYKRLVAGKVPPELDDPYYLLWEQLTALMVMAGIRFNVIQPVDFVFDEKKHMQQRVVNAYFEICKHANPLVSAMLGNTPRFESDQEIVQLQAADMLAWHLRRAICYPSEDRPVKDILQLVQPGMLAEVELKENILREFVEQRG